MSIVIQNRQAVQYDTTITMETMICCKCAIPFAIPADFKESVRKTQELFYCPNGHGQSYTKSTAQILEEKINKMNEDKECEFNYLKNQIRWKEEKIVSQKKENTVLKTKHTKFKNKIIHGVCPVDNCGRTFSNLYEHIKNQHPEYKINHTT